MTTVSRALVRARTAAAGCLFVMGALLGSWTARIPVVKHHLHLSTSELSIALVGIPAGLLIAMRFVPGLVARRSSAVVSRGAIALLAVSLAALGLMTSLASLTACLVIFGIGTGTLDVAINIQATAVERGYGRPVMSRLHALFSIGVLAGALAGSVTLSLGLSSRSFFVIMAAILAASGLLFARALLGDAADDVVGEGHDGGDGGDGRAGQPARPAVRLLGQRRLMAAGAIAFSGLFAEGAVNDWGGVFLRQVRGTSFSVAALGAAAFGIGMAIGRLGGDAIIERAGRRPTLLGAAVLGVIALAAAVLLPASGACIAAFVALGLVLATIVPNAFSVAGAIDGLSPAWAISRVTTIGYLGTFSSPAVIGFLAAGTGLTAAMLLPAVLLLLILPASGVALPAAPAVPATPAAQPPPAVPATPAARPPPTVPAARATQPPPAGSRRGAGDGLPR